MVSLDKMRGKLIVIEAGDGCGKETQTELLWQALKKHYPLVYKVEYPDYKSPSSTLVQMYLRGDFGQEVDSVNAYAASTFFAVDRYASYRMKWEKLYQKGAIILADRYTTSNLIYQGVKLSTAAERNSYWRWLEELEYDKMQLPRPDKVFFLDVPPQISKKLLQMRGQKQDIHEVDTDYLEHCYRVYQDISDSRGWQKIACTQDGNLLSKEKIHTKLFSVVQDFLAE